MSVLEVRNLKKSFGKDTVVLKGVDFSLEKGETVAIIGSSGSGKTTLLRCLNFLTVPDEGKIAVNGETLFDAADPNTQKESEIRRKRLQLGLVFLIFNLFPQYSSRQNVMLASELLAKEQPDYKAHKKAIHAEIAAAANSLLTQLGLADRMSSYPHQLSGGRRQRAMIAMALASKPSILIADEPTTALDVTIQAQILELMQDLRKKLGMSIIMITHDLGVVASMCEKIAVMYAGHIVEYGTTDEIFYQPGHEYTKGLINSIPKLNTAEHERLVPIEGTPVDLLNPPAGCPFAPRCKNCMKICLSKMPPRTELSDTHYTYCWLQQKAAFEKGEKAE